MKVDNLKLQIFEEIEELKYYLELYPEEYRKVLIDKMIELSDKLKI